MNIVKKLTLRHLRENMGRTVVTVLGIIVSVAMITAVFVSAASFLNFDGEVSLLSYGDAQVTYEDVSQEQLKALKEDDRIAEVGSIIVAEDVNSFRLNDRVSDRTGTGNIYSGDVENLAQMLSSFEGKLPQDDTEIAVERNLIKKNKLDWKIGDTVEIPVGVRTDSEGNLCGMVYGWLSGEKFVENEIWEVKITAIMDVNPSTRAYDIVRGLSEEEASGTVDAMVTLKEEELNHKAIRTIRQITEDYGLGEYRLNEGYLDSILSFTEENSVAIAMLRMVAVILALIIVASVMLIYNTFGMSLAERVRYLGMLASVGATKKQKRGSVYFEGFILGLIGIPVGILSGIVGIYITLKLVGQKLVSTGMIMGVSDSGMGMKTVVPVWAIVGIVLFSMMTLFISAFLPARKASKVTPIAALRQTNEIKVKGRSLRTPRYVKWMFGYEGELAHKSLKRNGRKSRMITISITLSVVLFLSVNYFTTMFTQANASAYDMPYQITVGSEYKDKDALEEEMKKIEEIDLIYGVNNIYYPYDKKHADGEFHTEIMSEEYLTSTYKNLFSEEMNLYVNIVEDEHFRQMCGANGIEFDQFFGDSLKAVLMNNVSHRNGGAKVFEEKILGQKVGSKDETYVSAFEIAGLVEYDDTSYLCKLNPKNCVSLYVPESTFYRLYYKDDAGTEDVLYTFGIETEKHAKVIEEIYEILDEGGYSDAYASDLVDMLQSMNTIIFVLGVFTYGFIVLITLITIANIINTISTGILLRKKEFAMLKSVGMTPAGFRKMICLESLLYGFKALIFGLPISAGLSYLMNKQIGSGVIPFEINWGLYLLVVAVVFLVIGLTMFYAVAKAQRNSIVETLKEEIN